MNKLILLLFLLPLLNTALAQDTSRTRKVKEKKPDYTQTFQVLEADHSVKHGPYEAKGRSWRSAGQYNMGERSGLWTFYNFQGQADQTYNFDTHTLTSLLRPDTASKEMRVWIDGNLQKQAVDVRPFFFGGDVRMWGIFGANIRYPAEAVRMGQTGIVIIEASITEAGQMVNERVARSTSKLLDAEALRAVKLLPDEWIPARLNGQPVSSVIEVPVRFNIK